MSSKTSLSNGLYSKRPFDGSYQQNKRPLSRTSIFSNTSASSYGRPPNPPGRRSVARAALDPVDNTTLSNASKDEVDWTSHLQEMKGREKQANERASLAELECQELKNKMADLKSSHQRQVHILVDELERYKSQPKDTSDHGQEMDQLDKVKQQKDQLTAQMDKMTLDHEDQWKEWQERLGTKTARINALESQLAERQRQIDTLEQRHKDDQTQLEDQRHVMDTQRHEIETLTSQLTHDHTSTQQLLATKDDRIKSLTMNLHDTTATVRALEQQLVAKDERLAEQAEQHQHHLDADLKKDDRVTELQHQLDTVNTLLDKRDLVIRELEDQLDDKYKATAELEQSTQAHQAALDQQIADKNDRIQQLTIQLERHQQDHTTQQLITTKNDRIQALTTQLHDATTNMHSLEQQLDTKEDRIQALTTQLHDATTNMHSLEQQLITKEDRLSTLQHQLGNKKREVMDLMARSEKAGDDKNTILELQQQLATAKTLVDKKTQEIMDLEEHLDDKYKSSSDFEQQQRGAMTKLQGERDQLADELAFLRDTLAQQKRRTDDESTTIQQLEQQIKQLDQTVAALREQVRLNKTEQEAKQQRLLDLEQEHTMLVDLKQKLADKTARVYELETAVFELDGQIQSLKAEAAHTSGMLDNAKRRESTHMKDQRATISALQQERDNLAEALADTRDSLARQQRYKDDDGKKQSSLIQQLERNLQQQTDMVASLRAEVRPLKKELDAKQHHLLQLTREVETLTSQIADRDDRVARLQHDKDQRTNTDATKDEKISQLERAMSNIALEMNNMSRTLNQYDLERTDMQHQMSRLEKDRQRIHRQLNEAQSELDRHLSATQRQNEQYEKLQHEYGGILQELEERTTYVHNLEERAHHMAVENDRLQGIAGTMERRSQQISDLETSVQAVNRQLTIALEERQALEIRHASLMKLLDDAKQSAGSLFTHD